MHESHKAFIDSSTYAELLSRWRMNPVGDSIFTGETGVYYATRMRELKEADHGEHVRASKAIG